MPVNDVAVTNASEWAQFGLGGLVIAALFAFIVYVVREHRSERELLIAQINGQSREWKDFYSHSVQVMDDRQQETNAVIRELTKVVSEFKGSR